LSSPLFHYNASLTREETAELQVLLVWAHAAALVHVFFPMISEPGPRELLPFLESGIAETFDTSAWPQRG